MACVAYCGSFLALVLRLYKLNFVHSAVAIAIIFDIFRGQMRIFRAIILVTNTKNIAIFIINSPQIGFVKGNFVHGARRHVVPPIRLVAEGVKNLRLFFRVDFGVQNFSGLLRDPI